MGRFGVGVLCLCTAMSAGAGVFRVGIHGEFPTISAAVLAAADAAGTNHEVRVESGDYSGSLDLTMSVNRNIVISGCWDGTFVSRCGDPTMTIWRAAGGGPVLRLRLYGGAQINVAALTLTQGSSIDRAGGIDAELGDSARLGLFDAIVAGNETKATVAAGVNARLTGGATLTLDDLEVSGNLSSGTGAKFGVGIGIVLDDDGSAYLANVRIRENVDAAASISTIGGGLFVSVHDDAFFGMTDSRIEANAWLAPAIAGAALFIDGSQNGAAVIARTRLLHNTVTGSASGTRTQAQIIAISDSLIAHSNGAGVAITANTSGTVHVQNATIAQLDDFGIGISGSGSGQRSFSNSIVHGTYGASFGVFLDGTQVANNLGDDINSQDPLFRAPDDFRLAPGSPAIDAGTAMPPSGVLTALDLDGLPRVQDAGVDIGAHETLTDSLFANGFEG